MIDRDPARTCCWCRRTWTTSREAGIGWKADVRGWSCPDCTRRRKARVDHAARVLISRPERWWLGETDHDDQVSCFWCDVVRRATDMLLSAPDPHP